MSESEQEEGTITSSDPFAAARAADKQRQQGGVRTTLRAHGRTADLVAGGLGRGSAPSGYTTLWVCDRCFKYMREGVHWELHTVSSLLHMYDSFQSRTRKIVNGRIRREEKFTREELTLFGR